MNRRMLSTDHEDKIGCQDTFFYQDIFEEQDGMQEGIKTPIIGIRQCWIEQRVQLVDDSAVVVFLILDVECLQEERFNVA